MDTWKLVASGRVQGVGFRWSVQTCAQELGLNGTVINNPDATVTITLQAEKAKIDEFIAKLPNFISPFAKIENIKIQKLPRVEKMHGFSCIILKLTRK